MRVSQIKGEKAKFQEKVYNNGDYNPTISDPYSLFLYALNSPVTMERYSTRLRYFLAKIRLTGNNRSIEELCKTFVEKGKQDQNWVINNIVAFLVEYKDRYDRREISGSTIRNYVKVVNAVADRIRAEFLRRIGLGDLLAPRVNA